MNIVDISVILILVNIVITHLGSRKLKRRIEILEKHKEDHDTQKEEADDPWRTKDTHKKK